MLIEFETYLSNIHYSCILTIISRIILKKCLIKMQNHENKKGFQIILVVGFFSSYYCQLSAPALDVLIFVEKGNNAKYRMQKKE